MAILALFVGILSACGGSQTEERPQVSASPGDWDAHIAEASERFRVPEEWIRSVMEVESGARTHLRGRPITSHAGAMGLMQVMPATYQELRRAHNLGPDPHNPRDNILAGTAYLRQMYDIYGFPGFLGAYNAGPGRYGDYVNRGRGLPRETRNYIARIEPEIAHIPHPDRYDYDRSGRGQVAEASRSRSSEERSEPAQRSTVAAADRSSSTDQPTGTSESRPYWSASESTGSSSGTGSSGAGSSGTEEQGATPAVATQADTRSESRSEVEATPASANGANGYEDSNGDGRVMVASLQSTASAGQSRSGAASSSDVIDRWADNNASDATSDRSASSGDAAARANLDTVSGPGWGVQVGAFRTEEQSLRALQDAARSIPGLGGAFEQVSSVTTPDGTELYRARLIGLSPDRAADACVALNEQGGACMLVTPS